MFHSTPFLSFLFGLSFFEFLLLVLVLFSLPGLARLFSGKGKPDLQGHWRTLIDGFQYSTQDFYDKLKAGLETHNIEGIKFESVEIHTGSMFSTKRLYLRITWRDYTYDICMAPFATGTFVSWWMYRERSGLALLISALPFIGENLYNKFFPTTYYSVDTTSMFMTYTQSKVLEIIDEITVQKGKRIPDQDRAPIVKDIFLR